VQPQQQAAVRPGSTSFDPTVRNLQLATGKVDGYRHAVKVRYMKLPDTRVQGQRKRGNLCAKGL
jgi:hypothetical protein